jgi:hypothetical protein
MSTFGGLNYQQTPNFTYQNLKATRYQHSLLCLKVHSANFLKIKIQQKNPAITLPTKQIQQFSIEAEVEM